MKYNNDISRLLELCVLIDIDFSSSSNSKEEFRDRFLDIALALTPMEIVPLITPKNLFDL